MRHGAGERIDELAFQEHLRTTVNELVCGVASTQPDRVRAVVTSLFDVSLDLFAAGLLGPKTKHPHVNAAWRELLPNSVRMLACEPTRVAGSISNALDHLAAYPSARPAEWIEGMRRLLPLCDSVPQWLDAGKVMAWRAGMVQYRAAALRLARAMPWKVVVRCLGAPDAASEAECQRWLDRLDADRWFSPENRHVAAASQTLRIVRVTGGFRGFGGPCLHPPIVAASNGDLLVIDGNEAWHLLADAFGTLWQRTSPASLPSNTSSVAPKVSVNSRGRVTWNGTHQEFPDLAEPSSFACDGQTLAVTLPTSHHVFLVAQS
jgi:hypothetical protein